jgi:hypothetical protein
MRESYAAFMIMLRPLVPGNIYDEKIKDIKNLLLLFYLSLILIAAETWSYTNI